MFQTYYILLTCLEQRNIETGYEADQFPRGSCCKGAGVTFVSPFITFATLNTQLSTGGRNFTVIVPAQQYI